MSDADKQIARLKKLARNLYCTRGMIWMPDCDQIKGYRRSEWCPSCRVRWELGYRPPKDGDE